MINLIGILLFITVVLCTGFFLIFERKQGKEKTANKNFFYAGVFAYSTLAFIISIRTFNYIGLTYADEYATSIKAIVGGNFWLYMNWLQLALLLSICIISAVKWVSAEK